LTFNTIIRLEETDSTNNFALQYVKHNSFEEGLLFIADKQTYGKGQTGNRWESESGKNLTFSFILKPAFLKAEKQFLISKISSLAVADMLKELKTGNISIKWPNDIYAGKQKIAGLLIENILHDQTFDISVVGIGININQTSFSKEIPNPVSLKILHSNEFELDACLQIFVLKIDYWYWQLKQNNIALIDHAYLNLLFLFNQTASFRYFNKIIQAKITGVNGFGKLQLQKEDGSLIECDFKELTYLL